MRTRRTRGSEDPEVEALAEATNAQPARRRARAKEPKKRAAATTKKREDSEPHVEENARRRAEEEEENRPSTSTRDVQGAVDLALKRLSTKEAREKDVVAACEGLLKALARAKGASEWDSGTLDALTAFSNKALGAGEKGGKGRETSLAASWRAACAGLDALASARSFFQCHPLRYAAQRHSFVLCFHKLSLRGDALAQSVKVLSTSFAYASGDERGAGRTAALRAAARSSKVREADIAEAAVSSLLLLLSHLHTETKTGEENRSDAGLLERIAPFCADIRLFVDLLKPKDASPRCSSLRTYLCKILQHHQGSPFPPEDDRGDGESGAARWTDHLVRGILRTSLGAKEQLQVPSLLAFVCKNTKMSRGGGAARLYQSAMRAFAAEPESSFASPACRAAVLVRCASDWGKVRKAAGNVTDAFIGAVDAAIDRTEGREERWAERGIRIVTLAPRILSAGWEADENHREIDACREALEGLSQCTKSGALCEEDRAAWCVTWGAIAQSLDEFRAAVLSKRRGYEREAVAAAAYLEAASVSSLEALALAGAEGSALKRAYAVSATSLVAAAKIRPSPASAEDPSWTEWSKFARAFLERTRSLGPAPFGDQLIWLAKSVYNLGIELMGRQAKAEAARALEVAFLALSALVSDEVESQGLEGQSWRGEAGATEVVRGSTPQDLALFGLRISEGVLKCGKPREWALMVRAMMPLVRKIPEALARVNRGTNETWHTSMRAGKGIPVYKTLCDVLRSARDPSSLLAFVDEALLSDTQRHEAIMMEVMGTLVPLLGLEDDDEEGEEGGGEARVEGIDRMRVLVQVASAARVLVCSGKRSLNTQYANSTAGFVRKVHQAFEEAESDLGGAGEDLDPILVSRRRDLSGWMAYNRALVAQHLCALSPTLAQDEDGHWADLAMEALCHWEGALGADRAGDKMVNAKWSLRATVHLCCEAAYRGRVDLLDRGTRLAEDWVSHCRQRVKFERAEVVSLYLGKVAYTSLTKVYSRQVSPRDLAHSIGDLFVLGSTGIADATLKSFGDMVRSAPSHSAEDLLRSSRAVNARLRSEPKGRLMRSLLHLTLATAFHHEGDYGTALAHAAEAQRLLQGAAQTSGKEATSSAEKATMRNLHLLCLVYMGDLRCVCGIPEDASRAFHEVLHLCEPEANHFLLCVSSLRLCQAYFMRCEWERARDHLATAEKARAGAREAGLGDPALVILEAEVALLEGALALGTGNGAKGAKAMSALKGLHKRMPRVAGAAQEKPSRKEKSSFLARNVVASQVSSLHLQARLQMAEMLLVQRQTKEVRDILDWCGRAITDHSGPLLRSKHLFATAVLQILERKIDVGASPPTEEYEDALSSAVCRLNFEDKPLADGSGAVEEVLATLLAAYREARGVPLLACGVAQALGLLLSPDRPSRAAMFLHEAIGLSYRLQTTYTVRTAFVRDYFSKTNDAAPPPGSREEQGAAGHHFCDLSEEGEDLRDLFGVIPSEAVLCSLTVIQPSDVMEAAAGPPLVLTRVQEGRRSVAVKLPFGGAKEDRGTFLSELRTILSRSNASMKQDWDLTDKREMRRWWTRRVGLDRDLSALMEEVGRDVLGPHALFLLGGPTNHADLLASLVDTAATDLGLRLDSETRDLLTLALAHAGRFEEAAIRAQVGVILASSSTPSAADRAEMVARRLKGASAQVPNVSSLCPGPVLLALDGHSQPFPWESLPSVRDQEFYRVPSLSYVREARAVARQGPRAPSVNWGNAYFLLNPSGDLESTQSRFESWFGEQPGWSGLSGEAPPSPQTLVEALAAKSIFLYFGHGTCEQYLPKRVMERLDQCSAVFLMGCSSARLTKNVMNQGRGFLLAYLLAGSPLAVGNLWDVTDKDIDRFARQVLETCLLEGGGGGEAGEGGLTAGTIVGAREACKLPALTGSSPVFYGIPGAVVRSWREEEEEEERRRARARRARKG